MAFEDKLVTELTAADVNALVGQPEGLDLDFKQMPYSDPYDLSVDVVAMANSSGGYIIVGVAETQARATGFMPLNDNAARVESERMRSWCHDWVRPRVRDLEIGRVEVQAGKFVIVARVPQSSIGPHMVTFNHRTQFSKRYQDGNREMTIEEIRVAFLGELVLQGIQEIQSGVRELLRAQARERLAGLVDDPNKLLTSDEVRGYMERLLRSWMEEAKQ